MKLKYPLLLTLLIVSNSVFSSDSEYVCYLSNVEKGKCEKNDILVVLSPVQVIRYCNLDRIVSYAFGDASKIDSHFICHYLGRIREMRGK